MYTNRLRDALIMALVVGTCILVATGPATAAQPAHSDDWRFEVDLYLWAASIASTSATGGDIDINIDTLLKDLQFVFMGVAGVRKGRWSLLTDVIYLDVDGNNSGTVTVPIGRRGRTTAVGTKSDLELRSWVVTPALGYTLLATPRVTLDVLAGARYLWLEGDLKVELDFQRFGTESTTVSDSGGVWDGIVGVRGGLNLTEKWYIPYYLDVGTGETDLTWQGFGGIGYRFKKLDVIVGYRYLAWDFDSNAVFADMNLSGPLVGVKFRF